MKLFNSEKINISRQIEVDIAKAVCITGMIIVHCFESFLDFSVASSNLQYFFMNILNCIFGAGTFMFCMGLGLSYSKNHIEGKDIIKRGCKIFLLGYLLNIFRMLPISILLQDVSYFIINFFALDIMQFAGMALILFGTLRLLKFNDLHILLVAIVLSILGTILPYYNFDGWFLDNIIGIFICTADAEYFIASVFPLINWFIFVAVGNFFGQYLIRCNDVDKLYKITIIPTCLIVHVYAILATMYGYGMMGPSLISFYDLSIVDATIMCIAALYALSFYHFTNKLLTDNIRGNITIISTNINKIYFAQWILIALTYFGLMIMGINIDTDMKILVIGIILVILIFIATLLLNRKRNDA